MSTKQDEEDGLLDDNNDEDDDDDEDEEDKSEQPPPKKRKKLDRSMIDDAAEESGDENGDDDDEDDDDEDNNDYIKDGFVVDEGDEEVVKKKKDDLEDSDDEDDDDDDDDDKDSVAETARKRLKKVRKMRTTDRLDDEDLALIQEAQQDKEEIPGQGAEPAERQRVMAKTEAELSRGLFSNDSGDEEDEEQQLQKEQQESKKEKQKKIERKLATKVERFDEDGMDDFIDDDIGDQGEILASDRRGDYDGDNNRDVNQAQLNEASEIFGTDYLEFMATEQPDEEEEELLGKYRERGVGIEMGGESEDEVISDDDDDDDDGLFGDEDEEGIAGTGSHQKAEALRLKREKRKLAKAERRRLAVAKKAERRKAQIRRVFEPVQLVENFCTDRDDEIRQSDIPERLFDWKTSFHGSEDEGMNEDERSEAMWIVGRVPDIMAEFHAASLEIDRQNSILESIANALRFMHRDKLEPAFIKRYRKDYVTSPAVQANLYAVMDEDGEWDRVLGAREKVKNLLQSITSVAEGDASMGADVQNLRQMQESLASAQEHLEDTAKQESLLKGELDALGDADDDDDDDELFGDDEENSEVSCFGRPADGMNAMNPWISICIHVFLGKEKRKNSSRVAFVYNPVAIASKS
jgi:hypothetical protein